MAFIVIRQYRRRPFFFNFLLYGKESARLIKYIIFMQIREKGWMRVGAGPTAFSRGPDVEPPLRKYARREGRRMFATLAQTGCEFAADAAYG